MYEQLKFGIEKAKFSTGLKQSEIAEKIGVKSTYLSDMINGRVTLTDNVCQKILELFHIDILNTDSDAPILKEQTHYVVYEPDTVSMPREVLNQLSKLTETILSQQRVIESQSGTIETLIENNKKTVALMEDNASNAGVKKASGA
ncbi:hypothetical protein AwDysgo_20970 [Bacteroidales bacterium]|nr:hypothetical protein AwDysgo_20970 [Bacteroidales bacterium]